MDIEKKIGQIIEANFDRWNRQHEGQLRKAMGSSVKEIKEAVASLTKAPELTNSLRQPQGLLPRSPVITDENRLIEVREAIIRYVKANKPIPSMWDKEYHSLIK